MKELFKRSNYGGLEKEWINLFDKEINQEKLNLKFQMKKFEDENIFYIFNKLSDKNEKILKFFIYEFANYHFERIFSTANNSKNSSNSISLSYYKGDTNKKILNDSFKSINKLFEHYGKNDFILDYFKNDKILKKINEISIDQELNHVVIYFIDQNVHLDKNKLLNIAIRNGNKIIFDKILSNFDGIKEGFKNINESPFFWKPSIFCKEKDFTTTYISKKLIDENFKISKSEINKMLEVSNNDSYYSYIKDTYVERKTLSQNLKLNF